MKIFVKAKPLAKEEKLDRVDESHFIVWVKEPPIKEKANEAIRKKLADYFKISASQVFLKSGFASKDKIFEIER